MFTGLVKEIGIVKSISPNREGKIITINAGAKALYPVASDRYYNTFLLYLKESSDRNPYTQSKNWNQRAASGRQIRR